MVQEPAEGWEEGGSKTLLGDQEQPLRPLGQEEGLGSRSHRGQRDEGAAGRGGLSDVWES